MSILDFLILYEHKQRELENSCLLKCELEKRGYSVKIDFFTSLSALMSKPKVLILPHLYDDFQVNFLIKNRSRKNLSVVDLQYEQILEGSEENLKHHIPSEHAKNAYHIAWGDDQEKKYLKYNIPKDNIKKTGCISMDLNHPAFLKTFLTREDLSEKYNISKNKKWIMFFANFTLSSWTKERCAEFGRFCGFEDLYLKKQKYMIETQNVLIEWITKFMDNNDDYVFIYRPHPSEQVIDSVKKLSEKYPNFIINNDYSIRQWISVADLFYTYYSTSLCDVYFQNKYCGIVRPVDVPENITAEIMDGAQYIRTYDDFLYSIKNYQDMPFPIKKEKVEYYYGNFDDGKAFERVADVCVEALKNSRNYYNYDIKKESYTERIKTFVAYCCLSLSKYISIFSILNNFSNNKHIAKNAILSKKELYKVPNEIRRMCKKFNKII